MSPLNEHWSMNRHALYLLHLSCISCILCILSCVLQWTHFISVHCLRIQHIRIWSKSLSGGAEIISSRRLVPAKAVKDKVPLQASTWHKREINWATNPKKSTIKKHKCWTKSATDEEWSQNVKLVHQTFGNDWHKSNVKFDHEMKKPPSGRCCLRLEVVHINASKIPMPLLRWRWRCYINQTDMT